MKLSATELLCSNNIDSVLAKDRRVELIERQTASELALGFTKDSLDLYKRTSCLNLQPVNSQINLSLAETISAPLRISDDAKNPLAVYYYPHRVNTRFKKSS